MPVALAVAVAVEVAASNADMSGSPPRNQPHETSSSEPATISVASAIVLLGGSRR
jgi:hypothetical protein